MAVFRSDPFPAPVELQLFGGVGILVDGQPPALPFPKKVYAMFARLALAPEYRCSRLHVANDIWPEVDVESLRLYYLRRALSTARKAIEPHQDLLLHPANDYLQLNLDRMIIDVVTFDQLMVSQEPTSIEAAIGLYKGPLLRGFQGSWITYERLQRQSAYLRGIAHLRSEAKSSNDIRKLIDLCRMAITVDPTLEREHGELIAALADIGDLTGASKTYSRYEKAIKSELGATPGAEIQDLHRRIVKGGWKKRDYLTDAPAGESHRVTVGEFLRPITPILGRDRETHKLCGLVRENRLVTITAAGGFGKTRLSLHVAEIMCSEFGGGVWFVDLAPVTLPRMVLAAIAEQLNVHEPPGVSRIQALKTRLQAQPTLIILDNCEHLRAACGNAALTLLTASGHLHVLATSRQSLGVTGESLLRLGALATPPVGKDEFGEIAIDTSSSISPGMVDWPHKVPTSSLMSIEDLQEKYPAVALFIQRARASGAFEPTPAMIPAIIKICARLEGNALAIELAAVKMRMYSVEDLDKSLNDMFATLVTDNPNVKPRQQTLAALIDWSYGLLPDIEAKLLARLSVFRGSWTLATAIEICNGGDIDRKSIPTLISNLADKSMIETISSDRGSLRFRLLEMIRTYAHNILVSGQPNESNLVENSFMMYYLGFAQRLKTKVQTNDQPRALQEFEEERENLRTALELSNKRNNPTYSLKLANSMWRYWIVRGHYSEGLAWFDRSFKLKPKPNLKLLCESYLYAGNIAYAAVRNSEARAYYQKCLLYETERGDPIFITTAQASIALVLQSDGAYHQALEMLSQSLSILEHNGKWLLAAVCKSNMANNYVGLGDYPNAFRHFRESIKVFRSVSHTSDYTHPMISFSAALGGNGDVAEALSTLQETMPLVFSLGSVKDLARALLVYVSISVKQAAFGDAAFLLGIYSAHNTNHRLVTSIQQRISHDRDLMASRTELGAGFQSYFDRGYEIQTIAIEQILHDMFQ